MVGEVDATGEDTMAGEGVKIPLTSMAELSDALAAIIAEYSDAAGRTAELEGAIGSPQGDSSLRGAASAFEAEWDDKRETQRRHLEEMKKRIDDTRQAWEDVDRELTKMMEPKA